MVGWGRQWRAGALVVVAVVAVAFGCRPVRRAQTPDNAATDQVARGAVFYGAYCAGCHGTDGTERGPLARFLDIHPPDLRTSGLLDEATDAEILARLRAGTPLPTAPPRAPVFGDAEVDALEAYLPTMDERDWPVLRAGRLLFEAECAACHGVYGDGDSVYPAALQTLPPDLIEARERYTDEQLAVVSVEGKGGMPRLVGGFEPMEMRAIVAYVRHLSPGYRVYDRYCGACHGDDGRGVHPEDALAPAVVAPPLSTGELARLSEAERRERIFHMLEREQGVMPHFRGLVDDEELADVVVYMRTWPAHGGEDGSGRQ